MSDYKTILERAGRSLPDSRSGLDDVLKLRDQKHRTRKITAGVVAIIVAAAGSVTAFTALGPGDDRPAGVDAEHFFALWPEDNLESALEAQDRVDGGEDVWRRDPTETASEFAKRGLYSSFFTVSAPIDCEGIATGRCHTDANALTLLIGRDGNTGSDLEVSLERLTRQGRDGIWSVTQIGGALSFPDLTPGAHLAHDDMVFVASDSSEPIAGAFKCGSRTQDFRPQPVEGGFEFRVPSDAFQGCRGFLIVARGIEQRNMVPLALTMFYPMRGPGLCHELSADDSCIPGAATALAMVPVVFDVAESPTVAPSPDPEVELGTVKAFVDDFMEARKRGSGASEYLSAQAETQYRSEAHPLYLTGGGRFTFPSITGAFENGSWSVSLLIIRDHGEGTLASVRKESIDIVHAEGAAHGFLVSNLDRSKLSLDCGHGSHCWRIYLVAEDSSMDPAVSHAIDQLEAQGFEHYTTAGEPIDAGDGSARWPTSVYWAAGPYPMCESEPLFFEDPQPYVVVVDFTSEADAFDFAEALDFQPFRIAQVQVYCQD